MSQEPTLFAGTIRDNIVYDKENFRESEVRSAASLANAHEFIRYKHIYLPNFLIETEAHKIL